MVKIPNSLTRRGIEGIRNELYQRQTVDQKVDIFRGEVARRVATSEDGNHLIWLGAMTNPSHHSHNARPLAHFNGINVQKFLFEDSTGLDTGKKRFQKYRSCKVERCVLPSHWELVIKFDLLADGIPQDLVLTAIDELKL